MIIPPGALQHLLDLQLPAFLQAVQFLFRLTSFLIILPVLLLALVDFAGYAVFRTLGELTQLSRISAPSRLSAAGLGVALVEATCPVVAAGRFIY